MAHSPWRNDVIHACHILAASMHPSIPAPGCADAPSLLISELLHFRNAASHVETCPEYEQVDATNWEDIKTVLLEGEEIVVSKLSHAILVHFLLFYLGFYVA